MTNPPDQTLDAFVAARTAIRSRVLGQDALIERLLVALLSDGHLLVEGAPGLAKTSAIKALDACIEASFHRIQFTPDLLPADITGSDIYIPDEHRFSFNPGPLFHNLVLADEINRAPAKVQSALLEAMEERQITVGDTTHALPDPFLVMATQNPIEQQGTFALPEAQLDRFMLRVQVTHPDADTEEKIVDLNNRLLIEQMQSDQSAQPPLLTEAQIKQSRRDVLDVHMSPALKRYLVALVVGTRRVESYSAELAGMVQLGASSRASLYLDRGARALAWLDGRDHVEPQDIQALAYDVLGHRMMLSPQAYMDSVTTSDIVDALVAAVPVP